MNLSNLTPMMRQYNKLKQEHPDSLLFFRLGDFYEMFGEDAKKASSALNITLTAREAGQGRKVPMCGVPHHSVNRYISRLMKKGFKVTICEQVEDPKLVKGIVKRQITRTITPGTVLDDYLLEGKSPNFLLSLVKSKEGYGLSYVDASAGEFWTTQIIEGRREKWEVGSGLKDWKIERLKILKKRYQGVKESRSQGVKESRSQGVKESRSQEVKESRSQGVKESRSQGVKESRSQGVKEQRSALKVLLDEVSRIKPSECLLPESLKEDKAFLEALKKEDSLPITFYEDYAFEPDNAYRTLKEHFQTQSLSGFGLEDMPLSISSSGAIIRYLQETQKVASQHITHLSVYSTDEFMTLDAQTRKNLELIQSLRDGKRAGTLLDLLDETCTSMGARLLRQFVEQPLLDIEKIKLRQEGVLELVNNTFLRADLRGELKNIQDLERLLGKIVYGTANARDLIALKNSLKALPTIKEVLAKVESNILRQSLERLDELGDLFDLIERSINDEPPLTLWEGNLIKGGFNQEVDRLRQAGSEGKVWMANLEAKERERTRIKSLKVGFTSVFGYYIEVTKPNLHLVPPDYTRKQTTANAERFVTEELKEKESLILGAEEKIVALEYELFLEVRKQVAHQSERIQTSAKIIASLDVLSSLAEVALDNNYVKPEVGAEDEILIYDGRHPVIEKIQQDERFVPNDAHLDNRENQLLIITGPNMAGKSTYLRQVALIVLMAQMGSFVPAKEAKISLVDRIFTRVGARDDITFGQSTFMMEMNEVANILHNATSKSLIVLDEIGRGTSTFDGLSIAWAVAEYIHNQKRIAAKTLFATHFHELTKLSETLPRVKNYNVAVKEEGEEVIFLRKIVPGGADRSYGIHVARLAGLPWEVLNRAKIILQEMEDRSIDSQRLSGIRPRPEVRRKEELSPGQLSFLKPTFDPLKKELEDLDINSLTPLEALNKLSELQKKVKGEENG